MTFKKQLRGRLEKTLLGENICWSLIGLLKGLKSELTGRHWTLRNNVVPGSEQ